MQPFATPAEPPWSDRPHPGDETAPDPRGPFARDRDRILHCASFRRLQYKTQVYIVSEGDYYRTRITHCLEVAQLARSLARDLGLCEDLAEAIALGHDVGHTPFGHAGERALDEALKRAGLEEGWNSNTYSLTVLDQLEFQHPAHPGLNLTYATRQGIARHQTPFDRPTPFDDHPQPTPEAQAVNLADRLAYVAHDVEDAIFGGLLPMEVMEPGAEPGLRLWQTRLAEARAEFTRAGLGDIDVVRSPEWRRRLLQRARRSFINTAVRAACDETRRRWRQDGIDRHEAMVAAAGPTVALPAAMDDEVDALADFLLHHVYQSPLVARQNHRERHILQAIFGALTSDDGPRLLPLHLQPPHPDAWTYLERCRHAAGHIASLSDRAMQDLYAELFDPRERSMGRPM